MKKLQHISDKMRQLQRTIDTADANRVLPEDVEVKQSVRDGSIYREILDEAKQTKADVIIMASHQPSLKSYLLGVNAARVVRHAQCSVYVVRE